MGQGRPAPVDLTSAEVILPGKPLIETLAFFTTELGFRVESIFPADAPRVAVVSGHGLRIRLDALAEGDPGLIRLASRQAGPGAQRRVAPNGTGVDLVPAESSIELPPLKPSFVIMKPGDDTGFGEGRAGMQYRDLIPGRFGGRYIASHIRIVNGGPVDDDVHHHHVRLQLIFCVRGWVSVVYEDQGPPIVLQAGDCFLQPPHIRHRVLESSDNMEVIELACPAEHETLIDHDMRLPTRDLHAGRNFSGQKFVCHNAESVQWSPWLYDGFEQQVTDIEKATGGLAGVSVIRATVANGRANLEHDGDLRFLFVLDGSATLACDGKSHALERNTSCAIAADLACELTGTSADFRILQVFVPSQ